VVSALDDARLNGAVVSSAADGLFAGPPVVGFTGRAAFDDRSEHDRLGQLVPGDRACGVVDQFDVVVSGRPSERWGQEVVAIVALVDGASADAQEVNGTFTPAAS
jgi:hypothetical protein